MAQDPKRKQKEQRPFASTKADLGMRIPIFRVLAGSGTQAIDPPLTPALMVSRGPLPRNEIFAVCSITGNNRSQS